MPRTPADKIGGPNVAAFLDAIAAAEGTAGKGDDGYNVVVGGHLFHDYSDHPRSKVHINQFLCSTAAGRYQILARYYDAYKRSLGLKDFSPESQDAIAFQMIKECGALDEIQTGQFAKAVDLCKSRWASFPAAGYGQHEQTHDFMRAAYEQAGGVVA